MYFVNQHIKHMRRIIFSCAACLTLQHLFTLFHKQQGYRKGLDIEYASGFSVPNLLETHLFLSRTEEKL